MNLPASLPRLALVPDDASWAHQTWRWFGGLTGQATELAVLPTCGLVDRGDFLPLDLEEQVSLRVLSRALAEPTVDGAVVRVLPPLRFLPRGHKGMRFCLGMDAAHRMLDEILKSVADSGFRKVMLYNANPWSEWFIDVAGRDGRIAHHLQLFCINLSGLDLDLRCHGSTAGEWEARWRECEAGEPAWLTKAGLELRGLIAEILGRPLLPNYGSIPGMGGLP